MVKYTIDLVTRTCIGQMVDSGYTPHSVSCSQGGLVFVTEYTTGVVRVRVYNIKTGKEEVWDTSINSQFKRVHVSLGAGFIVVSAGDNSYVYNQDRTLLYSVTHGQVSRDFIQTYVTETGLFWGSIWEGYKVLIMDLSTKDSKLSTEGIVTARSISGTRNGFVYVIDGNVYITDVGVYSADGTYLHRLHIDPPVGRRTLFYSGAIRLNNTEDLIAFSTYNDRTPIAVYRTHP